MIIVLGLGNPGEKYEKTRHNIGFMTIDAFAEKNGFPGFKLSKKFLSLISEDILNGEKVILVKPQTFMNESGKAVADYHKVPVENFLVVHDDLDLNLGQIKISKNRGAAGHKGVESIIQNLGTENFARFRMGIKNEKMKTKTAEKFVLEKFGQDEQKILEESVQKTVSALEMCLKEGPEKAMTEYNQ